MVAIMTGMVRSAKGADDEYLSRVITDWKGHINLSFPEDCRGLEQIIDETESEKIYKRLGYETAEEFFDKELLLNTVEPEYRKIFDWLKANHQKDPVPLQEGKIKALGKPGGDRRSEAVQDQPDNVSLKPEYGNQRSYTIARLKRDNPELAEKVINQEMSANAAAIEAGFRKRTICIPEDPEKAAETIKRRLGKQFATELKAFL